VNGPVNLRKPVWLWLGLCVAIFAPRAYLAVHDQGVIWPTRSSRPWNKDTAWPLAMDSCLGIPVRARSWFLPGVIGGFMKVLAKLGFDQGLALVIGTKLLLLWRRDHVLSHAAPGACHGGVAASLLLESRPSRFPPA